MAAPLRPDFHQISIFLKVVETRSFVGAARELGRSQPAISQAIARLEEIYGGDLFERRRGAPLVLTQIGEAILPSARTLLDTIDEQMVRAAATAQSRAGNLTIGIYPGLFAGPLRAGMAAFVAASPEVRLRVVEAMPGALHLQLNERAVDLIIVALMPTLDSRLLEQERLWEERLVLALSDTHPLTGKSAVTWDDVAALPHILKESHFELMAYRRLLDRLDREVRIEQHNVSCSTLLELVGLGLGVTIVFESGAVAHPGVTYRPISEDNAVAHVDAVWPKDDRNPLRHRMLSLIRDHTTRTPDRD